MTLPIHPNRRVRTEEKSFRIYTPDILANRIAEIIGTDWKTILDPCIGYGGMSAPFRRAGCRIIGCDIDEHGKDYCDEFHHGDFEWWFDAPPVDLVILNPPFNGLRPRHAPEVFIRKIDALYGTKIPTVAILPIHTRMNLNYVNSPRYAYLRDNWEISSIMALPRKLFEGAEVYSEVIFFNMPHLKPHYWM